jgi:cobalt-zinc-cadmium efflux system protein
LASTLLTVRLTSVVNLGGVALAIDSLTALLTYSMQKTSTNMRAVG